MADTIGRKATASETEAASDEAQERSILTGEVLREKGLCPFVIIRARDAGVHCGYLARYGAGDVELLESRRIWRWYEHRNTLSDIAERGAGKARISTPERIKAVLDACEIIQVFNEDAIKDLRTSRWE
jgi:hypothetical protein